MSTNDILTSFEMKTQQERKLVVFRPLSHLISRLFENNVH